MNRRASPQSHARGAIVFARASDVARRARARIDRPSRDDGVVVVVGVRTARHERERGDGGPVLDGCDAFVSGGVFARYPASDRDSDRGGVENASALASHARGHGHLASIHVKELGRGDGVSQPSLRRRRTRGPPPGREREELSRRRDRRRHARHRWIIEIRFHTRRED